MDHYERTSLQAAVASGFESVANVLRQPRPTSSRVITQLLQTVSQTPTCVGEQSRKPTPKRRRKSGSSAQPAPSSPELSSLKVTEELPAPSAKRSRAEDEVSVHKDLVDTEDNRYVLKLLIQAESNAAGIRWSPNYSTPLPSSYQCAFSAPAWMNSLHGSVQQISPPTFFMGVPMTCPANLPSPCFTHNSG